MTLAILTIQVACELDVIASRHRARQIAAICGFSQQDQARVATAVSEIARNAVDYAQGAKVRFSLASSGGSQTMVVSIEDDGPGIGELDAILARTAQSQPGGGGGIFAARRFMDQCDIASGSGGTTVVLSKALPHTSARLTAGAIEQAMSGLHTLPSNVALSEAHHQNRELTDALAALQARQDELVEVSRRLEETNNQVEALNLLLSKNAESLMLADRRKNEFLSMLSHELRGPLSAASMAAHLIEKNPAAADQSVNLSQLINRQVSHMSRLVEDLLDVSRVGRGLVSIEKTAVDLRDVVEAASEQIMPAARRKGHQVNLVLPGFPCIVEGDRTRLIQVIGNLLGNAIRYTDDGGKIDVVMQVRDAVLTVRVTDNGIGISDQLMPHLFDLYVQGEIPTDHKNGGLGLGLALVKSLMELHDGSVTASSEGVARGSSFEISLALAEPVRQQAFA
jgi:signal transduction histidine kinase